MNENTKYQKYLAYVKDYLEAQNGNVSSNPLHPFRNRFHHTMRVYGWSKMLARDRVEVNHEALYTAAVFHDVGYKASDNDAHAVRGSEIFRDYAVSIGMEESLSDEIAFLIKMHSQKELLRVDTPVELMLLMEADLLDEEGALGLVWDCLTKGAARASSYEEAYQHILHGSIKPGKNPMVSELARTYWDKKQQLLNQFVEQLDQDIHIGDELYEK